MKKMILFIVVALAFMVGTAFASPFLVCDPQAGVVTYDVEMDSVLIAEDHPAEADGSIRYDMAGTTDGEHTVRIKAENVWGEAWSDPFVFTKTAPLPPQLIKLSK